MPARPRGWAGTELRRAWSQPGPLSSWGSAARPSPARRTQRAIGSSLRRLEPSAARRPLPNRAGEASRSLRGFPPLLRRVYPLRTQRQLQGSHAEEAEEAEEKQRKEETVSERDRILPSPMPFMGEGPGMGGARPSRGRPSKRDRILPSPHVDCAGRGRGRGPLPHSAARDWRQPAATEPQPTTHPGRRWLPRHS
jgi:hypothetical protein